MRISPLVLLASAVALPEIAPGVSFSGDCGWLASFPKGDARIATESGHGFAFQPGLEAPLFKHLSLRTHAGFQWSRWGVSRTGRTPSFLGSPSEGREVDSSFELRTLTLGTAVQLDVFLPRRLFLSLGGSLGIPAGGEVQVRTRVSAPNGQWTEQPRSRASYGDSLELRFVDFGAGGYLLPWMGAVAGYRVPVGASTGNRLRQITGAVRILL